MVLIISVLIGLTLQLADAKPAVKYYATKYDHIDVEAILNNRRMVKYYSACLLSKGPCPPEGVEFKRILPEALQTNCGRCTEKQAAVTLRAIKRLKKEYPKIWSQLAENWDPDDVFVNKFEATYGSKNGPPSTTQAPPSIVNRFDSEDDQSTDNTVDGSSSLTAITVEQRPSTFSQLELTTQNIITLTNSVPSSTISTKTDFPYEPSSTTASSTTSSTTISTSTRGTTRLPPIPGLLPFNTFFTNPPIPLRPIVNLNIGANIGATVKAIKQVEKVVADMALEKIGMIKKMFLRPWRRTKRKYS